MIRLLIADDHPVVRDGLRGMVASEPDLEVVGEAGNGLEALALVPRVRPDVALVDLRMPALDGVATIRALRERHPEVRVLVLTTFDTERDVVSAIEAGATGYLLKDVLRAQLVQAIHAAALGVPTLDPRAQQHLMRQVSTPSMPSPFAGLTPRELDVLRLVARGMGNKQIASALNLSVGTVKGYVSAILPKINAGDRTQAALFAVKHGLEDGDAR